MDRRRITIAMASVGFFLRKARVTDETLNVGFFVFHTAWIVFNCVGWAWRRTRRWHLATVSLTALSWFGLGIRYGWGYCPRYRLALAGADTARLC